MKAFVDREECVGCGLCESVCPEVFGMDADGIAVPIIEEIPKEFEGCAKEAENDCPVEAIKVE